MYYFLLRLQQGFDIIMKLEKKIEDFFFLVPKINISKLDLQYITGNSEKNMIFRSIDSLVTRVATWEPEHGGEKTETWSKEKKNICIYWGQFIDLHGLL